MTTINAIGKIAKDFELKKSEKSGCVYANFKQTENSLPVKMIPQGSI